MNVQVIDRRSGIAMGALRKDDFALEENGIRREIVECLNERAPLDVILVIQLNPPVPRSKSSSAIRLQLRDLSDNLGPDDRLAVMAFSSHPKVLAPLSADGFSAINAINQALAKRQRSPGWRIYDAMLAATKLFPSWTPERRRRVVLLVFDKGERGSRVTIGRLVSTILESSAVVYGAEITAPEWLLSLGIVVAPPQREWVISFGGTRTQAKSVDEVVAETGGEILKGTNAVELLSESLDRIRRSYVLFFYALPASGPSEQRFVTVKLSAEAQEKYSHAIVRGQRTYKIARDP